MGRYRDIGMINEAAIESINPRTVRTIKYRVGDSVSGWTETFTLHVPPSVGDPTARTAVALFGDMGRGTVDDSLTWHEYGTPAVQTCLQLGDDATNGKIDAVFHFGDIRSVCVCVCVYTCLLFGRRSGRGSLNCTEAAVSAFFSPFPLRQLCHGVCFHLGHISPSNPAILNQGPLSHKLGQSRV